jgi:hypothetical protein
MRARPIATAMRASGATARSATGRREVPDAGMVVGTAGELEQRPSQPMKTIGSEVDSRRRTPGTGDLEERRGESGRHPSLAGRRPASDVRARSGERRLSQEASLSRLRGQ